MHCLMLLIYCRHSYITSLGGAGNILFRQSWMPSHWCTPPMDDTGRRNTLMSVCRAGQVKNEPAPKASIHTKSWLWPFPWKWGNVILIRPIRRSVYAKAGQRDTLTSFDSWMLKALSAPLEQFDMQSERIQSSFLLSVVKYSGGTNGY